MPNKLHLIDTHAHLAYEPMSQDISGTLQRAQQAGVRNIINICLKESHIDFGLNLAKEYPWIYNAAAVHPHDVEKDGAGFYPFVTSYAKQGRLIAIGETGLDYHYTHSPAALQIEYFQRHLQLAKECDLPIIIHCREAFSDLFKVLDEYYAQKPAVLHCFTGTLSEAQQVLERGLYLALGGIVTFKKSAELREVAKIVPLDKLLIETDAPFLAPQSKRGKSNEPSYMLETAKTLAEIKGITLEELALATTENARRLFRLSILQK